MKLKDYSVKLIDSTGRIAEISIDADSIRETVKDGLSFSLAVEAVEQNAFQNAIHKGLIGPDCWVA